MFGEIAIQCHGVTGQTWIAAPIVVKFELDVWVDESWNLRRSRSRSWIPSLWESMRQNRYSDKLTIVWYKQQCKNSILYTLN